MPLARVNGTTLHYEERGTGPAILYIHGSGDYSAFFERTVAAVEPKCRSIVYDRRGFAGSAGVRASGLAQHVEDAAFLLRDVGAVPATVVGSSAGGVVALGLTISHPEMVNALVLAEPTYQPAMVLSASASRAFASMYVRWLLGDREGAAAGIYRWITASRRGGNQFDASPEAWRRTALAHASAALWEITQLIWPWPPARAVGSIPCPVTLVIGDVGEALFHRTSNRLSRALPDIHIVRVKDSAHLIAVDQPHELAAVVREAAALKHDSARETRRPLPRDDRG